MSALLIVLLRLGIWLLLTADSSWANITIGLLVALVLPRQSVAPAAIKDWLRALTNVLLAIPQAYQEAIEIIFRPHRGEEIVLERVKRQRSPGLIFLDIFLITFTPKTIVLHYRPGGWYEIHAIKRLRRSKRQGRQLE